MVTGLEAGAVGRRVVDRRDHLDEAALHGDLDAEAAELALGLDPHVAVALLVQEARMRIERAQHALNRRFDEFLVGLFLYVVRSHAFEDAAEQLQLPIGLGALLGRARQAKPEQEARRHRGHQQGAGHGRRRKMSVHPFTLL
jgi:hypothetical protein